ncbi:MAG: D-alanyl-D-alanine carboxypeptidase family protein [Acutalibacteraceae bacterium]|nr:D-alanyl-D-alanine carboxypeptidase family protein [Acutalibacteraceae bacterium]
MKKRIFSLILTFFLILNLCIGVNAYEISTFEVPAKSAALISLDTGEFIYGKNIDEKVYPASMTQIMAAVVILEQVSDLEGFTVTMTESAYKKNLGTGVPQLQLKIGETLNGKDALAAMLVSSAGDAIYSYCEALSGSVEAFVDMMNTKAKELGLSGTHYTDPIGLHSEDNYTTVRDIVTLTQYAINKYPVFSEITGKARYTMKATNMRGERTIVTTNYMVDSNTNYFYAYCTGTKTGKTDEAGRCLTATAQYKGYRYLAVLMGCPNETETRFQTAREMFRWVFNNFEYKAVLDVSVPVTEMEVRLSTDYDYVSLYPEKQLTSILPSEADNSTLIIKPKLNSNTVNAPVKKGDILGTADVIYAETVIGTVNLVAGNDIEANSFLVFFDFIRRILVSTPFKIILIIAAVVIIAVIGYIIAINSSGKRKRSKVKYIPYDEEKERLKREKMQKKRKKAGRPEYNNDDDGGFDL